MKAATTAPRTRARAKAVRKPAPRKAKKTHDLSWLLDRPLPPESEQTENVVIYLRNQP